MFNHIVAFPQSIDVKPLDQLLSVVLYMYTRVLFQYDLNIINLYKVPLFQWLFNMPSGRDINIQTTTYGKRRLYKCW